MRVRTERARRYVADARYAFERAPVEVTISVLLAIAFSYSVARVDGPMRTWLELATIGALAAFVAFAATLLNALGRFDSRARWIVTGAGFLLAALYGIFVLDLERAAEMWRAAALVAGALLLLLASPAFTQEEDTATDRFRRVTGRLVLRTLAVAIYAVALYAGLALALGAVNTLFELQLDSRIYVHVAGWIFFVLVPWVIVGGVPDYVKPATERSAVAVAVHRLSAFLVPPLLAIYYLILYAYAIRIGVTGELPKNIVSPLVIAAGLIGALALVLFDRSEEPRPVQPLRLAAPLFVPLAALGLAALGMRLGQYGWTEFRALRTVLLAALGLLAIGATVTVLRRRSLQLHVVPVVLAASLIFAVIGPWNVLATSRRSQQARLAGALQAVGISGAVSVPRDSIVPNEVFENISSTARYLATHFGSDALPPVLQHLAREEIYVDYAYELGLRRATMDVVSARGLYVQLADGARLPDPDGSTVMYVRLESFRTPGELESPHARADSLRVLFQVDGRSLTADLAHLAEPLPPTPEPALAPERSRVPVFDAAGDEAGELLVLEVGFGGQTGPRLFRLVGLLRLPPSS